MYIFSIFDKKNKFFCNFLDLKILNALFLDSKIINNIRCVKFLNPRIRSKLGFEESASAGEGDSRVRMCVLRLCSCLLILMRKKQDLRVCIIALPWECPVPQVARTVNQIILRYFTIEFIN